MALLILARALLWPESEGHVLARAGGHSVQYMLQICQRRGGNSTGVGLDGHGRSSFVSVVRVKIHQPGT